MLNHHREQLRVFGYQENSMGGIFIRTIGLASPNVSVNMDHVDTVLKIKRFLAAHSRQTQICRS
jgi:hypothetical protein